MEENRHEAHEVAEQSKFLRWLDNFWFHYKWQTVAVLAVVILLAVTLPQCARGGGDSLTVTFAGGYAMTNDEKQGLRNVLMTATDGSVTLGQYSIFTEEEIIRNNTYTDPKTGEEKLDLAGKNGDKGHNVDQIKTLQNYVMTGDCGVWIVSPYVYDNWFDGKVQVVEKKRLGDLPVYAAYGAIRFLPEDCWVILTRSVFGETSKDKNFEAVRAYYDSLTGATKTD